MNSANAQVSELKLASFAGGCFWCVESSFAKLHGVHSVLSGYIGGSAEDANYEAVSSGQTDHYEAIQISYDPEQIKYERLLDSFWKEIDPTDDKGQFADRGPQYRPAIFFHDDSQKLAAEKSKQELEVSGIFDKEIRHPAKPRFASDVDTQKVGTVQSTSSVSEDKEDFGRKSIKVPVIAYTKFYPAEEYHQDYSKKNPVHYNLYRAGSGRSRFIETAWGALTNSFGFTKPEPVNKTCSIKPDRSEIKKKLTDLQYKVTQEDATERPFENEYWDNKKAGIYVDIVTGEALFSSSDKFDSGSGWPSFTQPVQNQTLVYNEDAKMFMKRTEVRSQQGDSHLGHVFDDGPGPTGKRYCINSAALRFIPADKLEQEGYSEFINLFQAR